MVRLVTPGSYPARIHVLKLVPILSPPVVLKSSFHTLVVRPVSVTTTRGRARLERRSKSPASQVPSNAPDTVAVTVTLMMATKVIVNDNGLVVVVSTSGGTRHSGLLRETATEGETSREAVKVVVRKLRVGIMVVMGRGSRRMPQQNDNARGGVPGGGVRIEPWRSATTSGDGHTDAAERMAAR